MSIAKLKKVTLIGPLKNKKEALKELQGLGCMHLEPMKASPKSDKQQFSDRDDRAHQALYFLENVNLKRRQVTREEGFDVEKLVDEVLKVRDSLRDSRDRREFLKHRIKTLVPWGDIYFPPNEQLAGYRLWFYVLPTNKLRSLDSVDYPWTIVSRSQRLAYVVLISKKEPEDNVLPVPRSHLGELPLEELRIQLEETEIEIEGIKAERQALTRYLFLLNSHLADADNHAMLSKAALQTLDGEKVVALQGWVPEDQIENIDQMASGLGFAYVIEDPLPKEQPPTFIEQPENATAGAKLATFYQVPDYHSWDPTWILMASFALFFAMIMADAGYGLVMLGGIYVFASNIKQQEHGRAYLIYALVLSATTIIYGMLVGSYFGVSPPQDSLLDKLAILDINNFDNMMTLSIIIGVIHICFANGMNAYVRRHSLAMLAPTGWCFIVLSALVIWLYQSNNTVFYLSLTSAVIGACFVVLFSDNTELNSPKNYLLRFAKGLLSLPSIMAIFGDVLSYMRLFALGLASASLAITFNDLASQAYESSPGLGLLGAILIIFIGHCLNLMLSLISGVVHGLRLNFIEFYKWGLPKEGKAFKRFARKEVKR